MSKELKEFLAEEQMVIGVLGAIGSGKSTLSSQLSEILGVTRVEENFPENPFLKKFYENPAEYSFRSQVWFLKSTIDQMISVESEHPGKSLIFDPANEMNLVYAKTHLDLGWMKEDEYGLYLQLYEILTEKSGVKKPDFFLCIDSKEEVLVERIKKRARPYELHNLEKFPEYLVQLNKNVLEFVNRSGNNIIEINSETDFSSEKNMSRLLGAINRGITQIENFSL